MHMVSSHAWDILHTRGLLEGLLLARLLRGPLPALQCLWGPCCSWALHLRSAQGKQDDARRSGQRKRRSCL